MSAGGSRRTRVVPKAEGKPCPFCGLQPTIQFWHGGNPERRMVLCTSEGCVVSPSTTGETPELALAQWNLRAPVTIVVQP